MKRIPTQLLPFILLGNNPPIWTKKLSHLSANQIQKIITKVLPLNRQHSALKRLLDIRHPQKATLHPAPAKAWTNEQISQWCERERSEHSSTDDYLNRTDAHEYSTLPYDPPPGFKNFIFLAIMISILLAHASFAQQIDQSKVDQAMKRMQQKQVADAPSVIEDLQKQIQELKDENKQLQDALKKEHDASVGYQKGCDLRQGIINQKIHLLQDSGLRMLACVQKLEQPNADVISIVSDLQMIGLLISDEWSYNSDQRSIAIKQQFWNTISDDDHKKKMIAYMVVYSGMDGNLPIFVSCSDQGHMFARVTNNEIILLP